LWKSGNFGGNVAVSTGNHAFKETDVRRAIRAAQATGLDVTGFEVGKDGAIRVLTGKETKPEAVNHDEIVNRLK
jgi:hypothetical protein